MYLVGYIPAHNRVYVADKNLNIYGYSLSLSYVEYQTAILRGDLDAANEILPNVPIEQRNKLARFLESQGDVSMESPVCIVKPDDLWTHRSQRIGHAPHVGSRSQI